MISPLAYVHPDAKLGENVTVEPFAYIAGDVEIGDDCWIGPGACISYSLRILVRVLALMRQVSAMVNYIP